MLFMQFKIGPDMGICLIKAILYALLSVVCTYAGTAGAVWAAYRENKT